MKQDLIKHLQTKNIHNVHSLWRETKSYFKNIGVEWGYASCGKHITVAPLNMERFKVSIDECTMTPITEAKELSLICCLIREEEIIDESLFQSFDKVFEIARAFVQKYGLDNEWGVDNDYESTVIEFATHYAKRNEWTV